MTNSTDSQRHIEELEEVVIRFAGDSGDGMQLTGNRFTDASALAGNDLATFPDYPSEIRAPSGTLFGVSGFQLRFSSYDIHTPGDRPDVLVAMNPAALKVNLPDLKPGGLVIANEGNFEAGDLRKAGYESNPLDDASINEEYRLVRLDLNKATIEAVAETGLTGKAALRCKNLFALGVMCWLYNRPLEAIENWLEGKFSKKPDVLKANQLALRAGWNVADNTNLFSHSYSVAKAQLPEGTYRNIMGNAATAIGLVAAAKFAKLPLFYGTYPITPASDILHSLARYKEHGVVTFQAEDEIAGLCSTIGAAYGGALAATGTSGPGMALKSEALGLAVMTELPLVIVNVQRGGPSTGLPTKTEQSDLLQALYGRHGEAPIPVIAAKSPSDCFDCAIEAARIAVTYMTPVILLSDGYLANGSEPWRLPKIEELPEFPVRHASDAEHFMPYSRDPETLARPWAVPGTPGLEHRVGGLEGSDGTGHVDHDPLNHQRMCELRDQKVRGIAREIPLPVVEGPEDADLLIVGWGSTHGAISGVVRKGNREGLKVARLHLRHIWPLPDGLGDLLHRYDRILVPELNLGQLTKLLRAELGVETTPMNKVQGLPFRTADILDRVREMLG